MPTLCEATRLSYSEALGVLVGEKAAKAIAGNFRPAALPTAGAALISLPHVGKTSARRIEAALAIGYWVTADEDINYRISDQHDAAEILMPRMAHLEQEELWVLLLNTRNRVLDVVMVYRGSLNSAQIRIGEIFKMAVRVNAAGIIVAHNHPSGDPTPSPDDVSVTRSIVEAGKLLDISVLDHLIIGKGRFVSLKERGLFPR